MGRLTIVVALVAVPVGYLIGTSPAGHAAHDAAGQSHGNAPAVAHISRFAIALNEFFEAAAVATRPPPVQVKTLATAYWQSEISYSLTKSGAIDAVGVEGSVACEDVAAKLKLVPDFLCRMMRAGEGIKLLSTDAQGKYSLTAAGDMLRSDHPASIRSCMLMIHEETKDAWRAVGTKSLSSGLSGFKAAFGKDFGPGTASRATRRRWPNSTGPCAASPSRWPGRSSSTGRRPRRTPSSATSAAAPAHDGRDGAPLPEAQRDRI